MTLTRRQFLETAGAASLGLSLTRLGVRPSGAAAAHAATAGPPAYAKWEDVYRQRWTWDKVAKGTHHVNCWYQRGCNWNVYVKDGLVWREEQVGKYPQTNAAVPDFNPRGCQKGACYSQRMYDPSRVTHPLKRVGQRGDDKWQRVSWDEALTDIADRVIDVLRAEGPGAIYWDMGGGNSSGGHGVGLFRTRNLLDTIVLDLNTEVGDHHPGTAVTCGKIDFASSADDWFYSDLILIWGGNPVYTQIPNAHFIMEARYHRADVVTITPDLNASAIHADLWVPVNIGTDAALGLSLAQVIVAEDLHDAAFIAEQTDLPLLVRKDTRRFLRASDVESNGADDAFYVFDLTSKQIKAAPRKTLALDTIKPALDGDYDVKTRSGSVTVTPVFSLLRERLEEYVPDKASAITGTPADLIRHLARRIGKAKAATIMTQSNFSKFYHGVEMERVQLLVLALCGHFGKKGAGMNAFPSLTTDANEAAGVAPALPMKLALAAVGLEKAPAWLHAKWQGHTNEMFIYGETRKEYAKGGFLSATLFFHRFGALAPLTGSSRRWDPHLKRDLDAHLTEAVEKGWQLLPTTEPKIFFEVGGNILRRVRGYDRLIDGLLPRLKLLVTVDSRLSNTARYSDYVLPAAAWYERDDITWATPHAPFSQATTKAAEPLKEAKADWVIHCLLMKTIQQRAVARGLTTFTDRAGKVRRLDRVYDDFTFGRRYTEEDPEALLSALLEVNSNIGGTSWQTLKQDGCARFTSVGMSPVTIGNATDIKPDETITANTWHTEKKMVWPTLTRRMQFYIDHDWYFELGEELPVHKDNPPIGGDYPLQMTGGHTRWSIHAAWRDSAPMLRLQRGGPVMYMSPTDAEARHIADGESVRVRNDIGDFEIRAKVSPAVRPGQVIVYHAWEPFQFAGQRSHQVLTSAPINPIQLAGGYYHLQPTMVIGEPSMCDRGTRVEVERVHV
ncbi:MAG: molybdopterin-dependent oxidoreductase [Deltaproteobacteria bacterium]|nr:molybdopterin-dependent oxidoreductase [Deltaproteobacteria bacterium]